MGCTSSKPDQVQDVENQKMIEKPKRMSKVHPEEGHKGTAFEIPVDDVKVPSKKPNVELTERIEKEKEQLKRLQAKLQEREKRYEENRKKEFEKIQHRQEEREKRAALASERRKEHQEHDEIIPDEDMSIGGEVLRNSKKSTPKGSKNGLSPVKAGSKGSVKK